MLVKCQHHPSRMYNQIWADAHVELSRLLKEEMPEEPREPEKDRVVFFQRVAVLYMRYLRLFRQLEKAYDQVVHPQKRRAIRPVLDAVMGRVLELKYDMVETEFSEYHYLDDVLHDMKLMPVSVKLESEELVGLGMILEILLLCCRRTWRSPSLTTSSPSAAKKHRSETPC